MSEPNPRKPTATEAGSEGAEKRLFASEPRSFKMDRKSPEASKLRASVSNKLLEFLGRNYSDDILAEYIVVLVCNGKHQKQARDDLEAFLGEDSGKFVVWLWHLLSEEIFISKVPLDSSSLEVEVTNGHDDIMKNGHKSSRLPDLETSLAAISNIPLSKNGKYESSNFSADLSKAIDESESLQRWCPSVNDALTEMNIVGTSKETCTIPKNSSAPEYHCGGIPKYSSSKVRCSPENSSGGDQCLQYENQVQKIAKGNSSDITCLDLPVPRTEPVARNLKSVITEDFQSRSLSTKNADSGRLPSTVMDAVPYQIARPRGNVWDRLGKPCNKDDVFMRQNQYQHDLDVLEMEKLDNNGKGLQKHRSAQVVPDAKLSNCGRVIPNNHSNEYRIQDNNFPIVGSLDHTDNSKRKRQFGDFSSGDSSASISGRKEDIIQYKEAFPKLQGSFPIKESRLQTLNGFTCEAKSAPTLISEPACQLVKSARTKPDLEADKVTRTQLNRRASTAIPIQNLVAASSPVPAKLEPVIGAEDGKVNPRPMQDDVLNVKSRLRQVEMNMFKLRSKQAEMSIDAKVNASSGLQSHYEHDIESRTVLVTNVHFAASREALLSHFTKCGVVLKVILLTDTVTAQPKGAAYIVFASKESIDKALSMSGTSFFSRILTVMRKADMPSGFLVPAQLTGKPLQPCYPQPHAKPPVQRQHTSSHLQWRRDRPASRENPSPATTSGLGSSNAGE